MNRKKTVYLYRTITIYDTVHVKDTIRESQINPVKAAPENDLEKPGSNPSQSEAIQPTSVPIHAQVTFADRSVLPNDNMPGIQSLKPVTIQDKSDGLPFLLLQPATFPENSIIPTNNLKQPFGMKKANLFGLLFLAVQGITTAQTQYGISAGGGTWWASSSNKVTSTSVSLAFQAGLFLQQPLSDRLFLKTEVNYRYLMPNSGYKTVIDTENWVVIGEGESASSYNQFSLPVCLGFKAGSFEPFLGMEYSYRISESWLKQNSGTLAAMAGMNYRVSDNISLGIAYSMGLTKDVKLSGPIIDRFTNETTGSYDCSWKSSRINCALYYSLKRNKPATTLNAIPVKAEFAPIPLDELAHPGFDEIGQFGEYRNDWALVKQNNKYGFINDKGEVVVIPIFDEIHPFGEYRPNWSLVSIDNKLGFINNKGKIVVEPIYDDIQAFGEFKPGLALVSINNKSGFINEKGKYLSK